MNRIALDLGFIQIYWYSITMFLGVLLGGLLTISEIKRIKLDKEFFLNMLFYIIIFGFIGARIYFVLFNLDYYLLNPIEILQVWNGGLAIHGAIIAGVLVLIIYSLKHHKTKLEIIKYLDTMTLGLILGQIIGRWGNFFNQEAHGGITSISFLEKLHIPSFIIEGMTINGIVYHPTFLYESSLNLIGLVILLIISRKKNLKTGTLLSIYLMWYSLIRFFIEGMRTDSLMLESLRVAQIISIILFIVGIIILYISLKFGDNYNKEEK